MDLVFSLPFARTVNRDNTISLQSLVLQIEKVSRRGTLAGCNVKVQQHLDGALSITCGPQRLGHSSPGKGARLGKTSALEKAFEGVVERRLRGKVKMPTSPLILEIPQTARDSHLPTTSAEGIEMKAGHFTG